MSETETPGQEPAHDVLAAEEFGVPAPDPDLHHQGPVLLPDDPTGIEEPHDVLAAEEFPMPAVRPHEHPGRTLRGGPLPRLAIAAVALIVVLTLRGRGRR